MRFAEELPQLRYLLCLGTILGGEVRLDLQTLMQNRLRVLVGLFGPLVGRLTQDVLANDDDGKEDQLKESLRDPSHDDDAVSTANRGGEADKGEDRKEVGGPHRADDRRQE